MSQAYGMFRADLIIRTLTQNLTPAHVATILEDEGLAKQCAAEIKTLRRLNDRWDAPGIKPRNETWTTATEIPFPEENDPW